MAISKEMVLYYQPEKDKLKGNNTKSSKLKGVFIRMGIRIKNISPEQINQKIGYLAGYQEYEEEDREACPTIDEEMLVMKNFTSRRIDELLLNLKRAGVPKISLKAVVTESNLKWSFYELYQELKKEHEEMSRNEET